MIWLGAALSTGGCSSSEAPRDSGTPNRDLRTLTCPMVLCYPLAVADVDALKACYGYDHGWSAETPAEVAVACSSGLACLFLLGQRSLTRADQCGCYDRSRSGGVPPECCSEPLPDDAFFHLGDALAQRLDADCGVALEPAPMACELAAPPEDRGDCGAD
ncbi:MAG: hypothetical protein ABMA64_12485 [Myxococcota bacterium]